MVPPRILVPAGPRLSLAPLGEWFFAHLTEASLGRWARAAVYVILIYGLFSVVWDTRNQMKAVDYRPEAAMWADLHARELPVDDRNLRPPELD